MNALPDMVKPFIIPAIYLALGALVFVPLQRFLPLQPAQKQRRRGIANDLGFFVMGMCLSTPVALARTAVAAWVLALVFTHGDVDPFAKGFGPLSRLPIWIEIPLLAVCHDFFGYWIHRAFHSRYLWRFHAVHHSSEQVDWMSLFRFHPVENFILQVVRACGLMLLGFSFAHIGLYHGTFAFAVGLLAHANVRTGFWERAPFKYLLVSPALHHWHHSTEKEGLDRNFATVFPFWDLLFGTFFLPDRKPAKYGTTPAAPTTMMGLLVAPFLPSRPLTLQEPVDEAPPPRTVDASH
jgi:sterol desaturase/sphingolipid hydroxylase (fatty acid hydroxylase superfamily)